MGIDRQEEYEANYGSVERGIMTEENVTPEPEDDDIVTGETDSEDDEEDVVTDDEEYSPEDEDSEKP